MSSLGPLKLVETAATDLGGLLGALASNEYNEAYAARNVARAKEDGSATGSSHYHRPFARGALCRRGLPAQAS